MWSNGVALASKTSVKASARLCRSYSVVQYLVVFLWPQRSCISLTPIHAIHCAVLYTYIWTSGRQRVDRSSIHTMVKGSGRIEV